MNRVELFLTRIFLNIFYGIFFLLPVNEKKIVFATPRSDALQGNFRYIQDEILRQKLDYQCIFLLDTYGYGFMEKVRYLLKLVKGVYHLETAGVFILDNAYLPVHILRHKRKTKVIQTWHACSAFKKFGLSTLGLEDGIKSGEGEFIHKNYDYAITTSHRVIAAYGEAFGMDPEKVIPLGVPRTDFFFNEAEMQIQKDNIYRKYPALKGKKTILYAPTFRGRGREKYTEFSLDGEKFLDSLEEEYVLLIKPHPHAKIRDTENILDSKKEDDGASNVVVFPGDFPLNALFCVADLLITDYSSVIFEFALLNKPMVFYPYDLQQYTESSSFYVDYTKFVPGPIALTQAELITVINEKAWLTYDVEKFARENFDTLDGHASRRFVERFLK